MAFLPGHWVKCLAPIGHVFKKDTDAGGLVVNMPWQPTHVASVEPGSVFRLVCSSRMVEMATVLDRFEDYDGIPHVRYQLKLGTPNGQSISEDMRVLALSAFSQRYDSPRSDLSAAFECRLSRGCGITAVRGMVQCRLCRGAAGDILWA